MGTDQVRGHGLELEVRGEPKNPYLDLTVIPPEHVELLAKRNSLRLTMPPPASAQLAELNLMAAPLFAAGLDI